MRFGETDVPLDERGRVDVASMSIEPDSMAAGLTFSGPERATRESAAVLSSAVIVDAGLASLDVGKWKGLLPEQISAADLAAWFGDPSANPHGGETLVDFVDRIKTWASDADARPWAREGAPSSRLVVAGPVAQALLCANAAGFFAVQVVPGRSYRL